MRPFAITAVTLALAAVTAASQPEPVRLYTRPRPPSRDVLDRLSLNLAWSTRLATEGARDGLFSVQFLPDPRGLRLIVQTLRGTVILVDAEHGDTLWRTQVGTPYWPAQPVAFDSQSIYAVRRDRLFVLDRDTGKQVLWDVDPDSKQQLFGFTLEGVPSAGLVADEDQLYACMGSRVSAYFVPNFRKLARLGGVSEDAARTKPSPQLRREWTTVLTGLQILQPPLLTDDLLGAVAADGTVTFLTTLEGKERAAFQVDKKVSAQAAQHGHLIYLGSEDYQVYAIDVRGARLRWRFTGGAPILLPVRATDRDVYVSPDRVGLSRLDRATGSARWRSRDAERFLATNHKFLYALDRFGKLLVMDYERGTALAEYDTRDWPLVVANEITDRIYLAAHDGSLACLHHRDFPAPLRITTPALDEAPPKTKGKQDGGKKGKQDGGKKADDKKPPEKKKEDDVPGASRSGGGEAVAGGPSLPGRGAGLAAIRPQVAAHDPRVTLLDRRRVLGWPLPAAAGGAP